MDIETLKLLGSGSAQLVLAAGYIPMFILIKKLWSDRDSISEKLFAMLELQFADSTTRKELWNAQAKVIDGQTGAIKDLTREITALQRARI